ncbi:MAG: ABC transporter substrate-binding protein [Bacteroidales bacterium]|nr:ABC transporter substrate-binding protein [Bacteroidales bacterium]
MSRLGRPLLHVLVISSLVLVFCGCRPNSSDTDIAEGYNQEATHSDSIPLQKIRLLPYWNTTAQFAGYYIGIEEGIFQQYGIDLEIIPYLQSNQTDQMIPNREADFSLLWLVNAIDLKESGLDIVNIAQLSSRSSLMLITKKSSGIETIADMNGKRAAIWSDYTLQPKALFRKNHVDVKIVPIGSSNNLFLTDGVEIINASWFDEYHTILNCGYDTNELETFFFSDYGLNFLEDGIYCLRSTLEEDPELCKRFVEATLESWKYAFDHPEEAIRTVLDEQRNQKIPANLSHQRWMLNRYRDLYYPDPEKGINTTLSETEYQNIAKILVEAGLIGTIPPFASFYQPVLPVENSTRDMQTTTR